MKLGSVERSFRRILISTSEEIREQRISALESATASSSRYERLVKNLTLLGALIAFSWGLYQHFDAKEMEFRKGFWEKQYSLYSRVTRVAAAISIAPNLDEVATEREEFWSLYWGELSIVENQGVHHAMVDYGKNLSAMERNAAETNRLKQLSYYLARACRHSLKTTWEPVPLDDIADTPRD